jgi:hypothetical protein
MYPKQGKFVRYVTEDENNTIRLAVVTESSGSSNVVNLYVFDPSPFYVNNVDLDDTNHAPDTWHEIP